MAHGHFGGKGEMMSYFSVTALTTSKSHRPPVLQTGVISVRDDPCFFSGGELLWWRETQSFLSTRPLAPQAARPLVGSESCGSARGERGQARRPAAARS